MGDTGVGGELGVLEWREGAERGQRWGGGGARDSKGVGGGHPQVRGLPAVLTAAPACLLGHDGHSALYTLGLGKLSPAAWRP